MLSAAFVTLQGRPPGSGNLGFPALAVLGGSPPSDSQCALGPSAPLGRVGFTGWSGERE